MHSLWNVLTHWDRVTHICVSKLTIISSDNGLSPGRRQAIIWTNAGKLLFGPPGTNFSEILIEIHIFSFKKMHLKMSSAKWCPFCLGLNVLRCHSLQNVFPWSILMSEASRKTWKRLTYSWVSLALILKSWLSRKPGLLTCRNNTLYNIGGYNIECFT